MDSLPTIDRIKRNTKEIFETMNLGTIGVSDFVKRQTKESSFSYFDGTWEELRILVQRCFCDRKPGYRDGVLLVPVPVEGDFYSAIKVLKDGDKLVGDYSPRKEGETPRKHLYADGEKTLAKYVEIILYRYDVLEEDGDRSTNCDWEIISINASPDESKEIPMQPNTMIANHFHLDGGTQTNMSNDEFVKSLKESIMYWKDKALVKGEE